MKLKSGCFLIVPLLAINVADSAALSLGVFVSGALYSHLTVLSVAPSWCNEPASPHHSEDLPVQLRVKSLHLTI